MGSSNTSSTQTSNRDPWAPTLPVLKDLIHSIRGQFHNWQPTANENDALHRMMLNAQNYQGFGKKGTDLTGRFMSGDPNNLLMPGYQAYKNQMTPFATQDVDPTKTPGMANLLSTIQSDIGNNVNGMFAGAGRDLSGAHMQSLSRGISQGMAAPLLNQYNQNVSQRMNASNGLLGAAGATSTAMGQNQQTGMNMAQMLPGLINQPQTMQLQAEAMKRSLPLQNLAQLEAMILPIAGLGGQSVGRSWSESNPSLMSQIGSGMQLAGTGFGLGGALMGGMPMMAGGMNPFGAFTGNYFPGNPAAAGAQPQQYGGQYFPSFA